MRTIILWVVLATLPTIVIAAERPQPKKPPSNPCAAYGAGFKQVEGTSTCVKVGGTIQIDAGGRVR